MTKEIESKLRNILKMCIEYDSEIDELQVNDSLQGLSINSLTFIKIVVAIEGEFDIELDDDELNIDMYRDLGDLIKLIQNKVA